MTEILFSFDTEDYVNARGAEGILGAAELLHKAGVKGNFVLVARLAQALVKWGRTDVIDALQNHELGLHSLSHTYHPCINEYTDLEDFEEAKKILLEQENEGRRIISEIFGERTYAAACPPGHNVSYVAHYGYAEMGIPLYCGDFLIDPIHGRHIFGLNVTCTDYHLCLDHWLRYGTKADIDAKLEEIAQNKDMFIFYHHPHTAYLAEHPDILNFNGKNVPEEEWVLSPNLPEEDTKRFYENFAYLVEKLKADPRFHLTTYSEFAKKYCYAERTIERDQLPELKKQLEEYFFPVTTPDSYCISDILLACRDFLTGKDSHKCGNVYGFLETPYEISRPVTVTADDIRASAEQIGDGFLPQSIVVGQQEIGLRDWLFAAMEVLEGAETVTLQPAPWQIDMDQFPKLRDMNMKGAWIFWDKLEDKYLSDRFRMQSWTFRLPKDTQRTIF